MIINKDLIPIEVLSVLYDLQGKGYVSYLVGGCVRDLILGKTPKDYDICTVATPDEIKIVFKNTKVIDTGLKYGTVTVLFNKVPIEVTTFRKDGNYSDGRRPDKVKFGTSILQDVERRDFTMNGLLFDGNKIYDYIKGENDLKRKKINTIGKPDDRFKEDSLRMLRAIRFSCQLGFSINPDVLLSIRRNRDLIKNVSQERIRDELIKILLSDYAIKGVELLKATELLKLILPELDKCIGFDQKNKHHRKNIYNHIIKVLDSVPNNLEVRLAALLHDIAKPITFTLGEDGEGHFYSHHLEGYSMTKTILKRLKFDNETIEKVAILVKEHMSRYPKLRSASVKKLIGRVGKENIENLINLQIADIIGSKPPYDFKNIIELQQEIERVLNEKEPISLKDLAINGNDLIKIGMKPGKDIGSLLKFLLSLILETPEFNIKENLLKQAKVMINNNEIEKLQE